MVYQVVTILSYKKIRFKPSMIRSDLCDYSDVYIAAKNIMGI